MRSIVAYSKGGACANALLPESRFGSRPRLPLPLLLVLLPLLPLLPVPLLGPCCVLGVTIALVVPAGRHRAHTVVSELASFVDGVREPSCR